MVYAGDVANEVRVLLRLAPELHAELKEIAQAEDRSINAQIGRALREWLAEQKRRAGQ